MVGNLPPVLLSAQAIQWCRSTRNPTGVVVEHAGSHDPREGRLDLSARDKRRGNGRRAGGEVVHVGRADLRDIPFHKRARIDLHDHSRFSTTMPARVRFPRRRTPGAARPSRRPLHCMAPAFISTASRSSNESPSGANTGADRASAGAGQAIHTGGSDRRLVTSAGAKTRTPARRPVNDGPARALLPNTLWPFAQPVPRHRPARCRQE